MASIQEVHSSMVVEIIVRLLIFAVIVLAVYVRED